ncbi:hypothetical protein ACFV6F_11825 [Kitasatospora phosalacinea]|uniref:hypothetical protein n=1 Tax=Kitasatospora phosalacinea TaxID=2065 RepID=UPI0036518A48
MIAFDGVVHASGETGNAVFTALLVAVLALTVVGSACAVWAGRGGPRWVQGVASVVRVVGEMVRENEKKRFRKALRSTGRIRESSGNGGNSDGD